MRCRNRLLGLGGLVVLCGLASADNADVSLADIDRHALAAPAETERSVISLATYLSEPAKNDVHKARAIFRWITDRVRYDVDAYFTDYHGDLSPQAVLDSRKALAAGQAYLFHALATQAGLDSAYVPGFAKGIQADREEGWPGANHVWNAVKVDGRWGLVDCARGAGFMKGQRFRRVFQEQYFLTPPPQLALTHFPADPGWQLLARPVTWQEFHALPYDKAAYFNLGVTNHTTWQDPAKPGFHSKTTPYLHFGGLRILSAPRGEKLPPGHNQRFLVEALHARHLALVNNDEWVYLKKTGTRFEGSIAPRPGTLKLMMQPQHQDGTFQSVMSYTVDEYLVPWIRKK